MDAHGVAAADAPALADAMRSYGVRWHNMRKNVHGGTYAFNWLQRRLLPKMYESRHLQIHHRSTGTIGISQAHAHTRTGNLTADYC